MESWKKKRKANEEDFFQKKERELLERLRSKVNKTVEPQTGDCGSTNTPTENKKEEKASWSDDLI